MEEKRITHYSSKHKILLVGEGDFSFSLCLAKAFGSASNMFATSLDSRGSLASKYSRALTNVEELKDLGCTLIHGVDVFTMSQHPLLQDMRFDRVVFNFSLAVFVDPDTSPKQIKRHQKLVMGFMRNAGEMLREYGEIHVTHRITYPYDEWEIETLGSKSGLYLKEEAPFSERDYEGYCIKRGNGKKFKVGECSTFKFMKVSDVESLTCLVSALRF